MNYRAPFRLPVQGRSDLQENRSLRDISGKWGLQDPLSQTHADHFPRPFVKASHQSDASYRDLLNDAPRCGRVTFPCFQVSTTKPQVLRASGIGSRVGGRAGVTLTRADV